MVPRKREMRRPRLLTLALRNLSRLTLSVRLASTSVAAYWIPGCTEHMFPSALGIINLSPSTRQITVADGKTIVATQTGDLVLKLRTGRKILLERSLVVPDLKTAFISISTIAASGYSVEFDEEKWTVRKGRTVILEVERNGKLYLLSDYCVGNDRLALSVVTDWHLALGHPLVDKFKAIS
jgi:hypothetical protein